MFGYPPVANASPPEGVGSQGAHPRHGMDPVWRAIVNDPQKLDGIVNAMANCMGKVLSIKDPDVANGRLPLGKALYDEKEHFPTRSQLDEVENIQQAMGFVARAHLAAGQLRASATLGQNVLLTQFRDAETYCHSWLFTRPRRGTGDSQLKVGGLRRALYRDVKTLVYRWLMDCDAAMMVAFRDVDGVHNDHHQLTTLAHELSEGIACRLTLMPEEGSEQLSTESLTSRATQEVAANAFRLEESNRTDLIALRALETLAREGPGSECGKLIVQSKMHQIMYIVNKPPEELGLHGVNAQYMNLPLLARACDCGIDPQVVFNIVRQWHEWHGACTATAAAQAIQKLQLLASKSSWDRPFIKVLQKPEERPAAGAMAMPRMPFAHSAHRWVFVAATPQRTPFDWIQRRCVRLTSLVLQLLGHGALERGVVSASVVGPVATQAILEAQVVMEQLAVKLETYSLGTKLLRFCENVTDIESHLSRVMSDATLFVSHFSTLELLSIFSPQSPALRVIMGEFTRRTRIAMGNARTPIVPIKYVAFAYDAMAILLPVVRARRERLGIGVLQAVNPLRLLLYDVPIVRTWSPLHGSLHLDLETTRGVSPLLKPVLEDLARRQILVQYKRPYLGNQKKAPRKAFVFNSAQLLALLGGHPLDARPAQ